MFAIVLFIEFAAWGLGYVVSVSFSRSRAAVIGMSVLFAFCVCSGLDPTLKTVREEYTVAALLWYLSFASYAAEAFYLRCATAARVRCAPRSRH